MDAIVKKMNYVNPSEKDQEDHMKIHDEKFDLLSKADIEKVLLALADKLRNACPQRCQGGFFDIGGLINRLKSVIENRDDNEAEKIRLALYPTYLKVCEACILGGFSSAHVEIMQDIVGLFPWDNEKEGITMAHFRSFMDLLKLSDFVPPKNDEQPDYAQDYGPYAFRFFIERVGDEFIQSHVREVSEYTHFLSLKMWNPNPISVKFFSTVHGYFHYALNSDIMKTIAEADKQLCIQLTEKIIQQLKAQPIPTEVGQQELGNPIVNLVDLFREDAKFAHDVLSVFVTAWLELGPLKGERPYLAPICERVACELRVMDSDMKPVVYKDGHNLVPQMRTILERLLEEPVPTDRDAEDEYKKILEGATDFLVDVSKTKEHVKLWFPALLQFIAKGHRIHLRRFADILDNMKTPMMSLIKAEPKHVCDFVDVFLGLAVQYGPTYLQTEDAGEWNVLSRDDFCDEFRRAAYALKELDENNKVFVAPEVQQNLISNTIKVLKTGNIAVIYCWEVFHDNITWKKATKEDIVNMLEAFKYLATLEKVQPVNPAWVTPCQSIFSTILSDGLVGSMPKLKAALPLVKEVVITCLGRPLQDEMFGSETLTFDGVVMQSAFTSFMLQSQQIEVYNELYPVLLKFCQQVDMSSSMASQWLMGLSCGPANKSFAALVGANIESICQLVAKLLEEGTNEIIQLGASMINTFMNVAEHEPQAIVKNSSHILKLLDNYQDSQPTTMCSVLLYTIQKTAASESEFHTPQLVKSIIRIVQLNDKQFNYTCLAILDEVSKEKAHLLFNVEDKLMKMCNKSLEYVPQVCNILHMIANADSSRADAIFPHLDTMLKLCEVKQPGHMPAILNSMRQAGVKRPDLLAARKSNFENLSKTPALHDICQHLLDVIAERNLANMDVQLGQQKARVEEVRGRVDKFGRRVDELGRLVDEQGNVIVDTKKKVDATQARVSEVELNVDRLEVQVEEVDRKTMSNAPKWSRDVTLLLNPESESDWRLLARRLNYTVEDVRAWATQSDPCMALLSEWYATHRGVEATRAVLSQLKEMGREDAAHIVEMALTAAESAAADEEPAEFLTPPAVFLSYQWGHQAEVKVLRHHLEKAGYRCWMDIGQMGGGDKLFEALDRGIRGCKVLVSCINEKYCASDNCKREINLAVNLGKPLIPLQLERVAWPPPGTLGPLLAEYLFIRMFARANSSEVVPGTFWPAERFQELLMQIRYHCPPEYELVHADYANWWAPPELPPVLPMRVATFNTATEKQSTKATSVDNSDTSTHPLVFISYQWEKQKQVRLLHSRLTSLGYSCWMDIYQMGGGDSLYDKIDRGVRNCRVVIACVTPKYSQSINCRREISLADALKKPIIPLMLETMSWPPEGPMSMALTQLMYIQLSKDSQEQTSWDGPKTEELLKKLREIVPAPTKVGNSSSGKGPSAPQTGATKTVANSKGPAGRGNEPQVAQRITTKSSGPSVAANKPAQSGASKTGNAPKPATKPNAR